MQSNIPAAERGILAALDARPALADVQREPAHPGKYIRPECIYLGTVQPSDETARNLGNRTREEQFTVEVVFTIEQPGNDAQATNDRVWALVAELEQALVDDPTLGGAVRVAEVSGITKDHYPGDGKRVAEAVVHVECRASKRR